jgi:hypothetical protein
VSYSFPLRPLHNALSAVMRSAHVSLKMSQRTSDNNYTTTLSYKTRIMEEANLEHSQEMERADKWAVNTNRTLIMVQ